MNADFRMECFKRCAAGVRRSPFVPEEVKAALELLIAELTELRERLATLEKNGGR